jgi:hypothetical protein
MADGAYFADEKLCVYRALRPGSWVSVRYSYMSLIDLVRSSRKGELTRIRPYLIRHNLIALHSIGAPQVYPVCIQANLVSSGSTVPTDTVKFPEAYNTNDMFKTFNVWTADPATFVPPGPPVYNGGGSAPAPAPVPSTGPSPSGSPSVSPSVDPVPVPTGAGGNGAAVPTTDAFPAPAPTTDAAPVVSTDVAPVPSVVPTPAPAPAPVPTRSCKRKRRSLVY